MCNRIQGGGGVPFFSRFFSPGCKGVDVLAQQLEEGDCYYCFPPKAILKAVVNHIRNMRVAVVLVTPTTEVSWYPMAKGCMMGSCPLQKGDVRKASLGEVGKTQFVATLLNFGS